MIIITIRPGFRNQFNQIMISLFIFCQYNQVTARIFFRLTVRHQFIGHIHFTAKNWNENLLFGSFQFCFSRSYRRLVNRFGWLQFFDLFLEIFYQLVRIPVLFLHIVKELLDTEHITMVGQGKPRHAVSYSLINQRFNGSLSVKYRILGVNM